MGDDATEPAESAPATLDEYGWDAEWAARFAAEADAGADRHLMPGRVIEVHQRFSDVMTEVRQQRVWNTIPPRRTRPATGDWVALDPDGPEDMAAVAAILPRRSELARRTSRGETEPRTIAANMDIVVVVVPMANPLRLSMLARYLIAASATEATPVLLLTKADLSDDVEREKRRAMSVAGDEHVYAVSTLTGEGLEDLHQLLVPRRTSLLIGPSGAGKSTLVNHLVGTDVQRTGVVSASGSGKHTTSSRRLIRLPDGGLLLDTPGLGDINVWDVEYDAEQLFPAIRPLVAACRFRDCSHDQEPDCAVREALRTGQLDPEGWAAYREIEEERRAGLEAIQPS